MRHAHPLLTLLGAVTFVPAAFADIYLPEGDADSVLHLADDLTEIGRIDDLENPHGLALAPARGLLVIGSLSETETDGTAPDRPEGMSEADHAAHHGGGGMDAGRKSLVSFVRAADHAVTRQIEVPGMVHHVAVDATERFALVTHPGPEGVSIIGIETGHVRGPIRTGPEPEYAVWSPEEETFVVSNAGNATLSHVDPERGIVLRNVPMDEGPKHLARAEDGAIAVALADAGLVALVVDDRQVERFEVGGELHGIGIDENAIWVSAKERDAVVRIDRTTGEMIEASPGAEPYHLAVGRDGLLVSSAAGPDLWRLDPSTLEVLDTTEAAATVHQIHVGNPS